MGVELNNFNRELYYDASGPCTIAGAEYSTSAINNGKDAVKHSLKSKILERRKKLGLGNIKVDFNPKSSYPMTAEEKEKDKRRKQSNRNSAQKCRQKQKEEYERNKKLLIQLREEQETLLDKVKETENEKNKVLFSLRKVLPETYIHEAIRQIKYSVTQRTDNTSQIGEGYSDQSESPADVQTESSEAIASIASSEDGFGEDDALNLEENSEGEIYFASLFNGSEDIGNVNGNAESLEVGNEVTLQLFDNNFVSKENTYAQAQHTVCSTLLDERAYTLSGTTIEPCFINDTYVHL